VVFSFSHRYHHRCHRRRRQHMAQTMTIELSERILDDRFFAYFKG
jgi:hypothetical protein